MFWTAVTQTIGTMVIGLVFELITAEIVGWVLRRRAARRAQKQAVRKKQQEIKLNRRDMSRSLK